MNFPELCAHASTCPWELYVYINFDAGFGVSLFERWVLSLVAVLPRGLRFSARTAISLSVEDSMCKTICVMKFLEFCKIILYQGSGEEHDDGNNSLKNYFLYFDSFI